MRKESLELQKQARVPNSIKSLRHIEEDTPAILLPLKSRRNYVNDSECLLGCGVFRPETKLMMWDNAKGFCYGKDSLVK